MTKGYKKYNVGMCAMIREVIARQSGSWSESDIIRKVLEEAAQRGSTELTEKAVKGALSYMTMNTAELMRSQSGGQNHYTRTKEVPALHNANDQPAILRDGSEVLLQVAKQTLRMSIEQFRELRAFLRAFD